MAITKIQSGAFPADVITSSAIDDLSVTHAKLHTTMDLSSKTVTLPTLSTLDVSGTVTADGLTVDGGGVLATFGNTAGNNSIGVIRTTTSPSAAYLGAYSNTGLINYSGSGGFKFTNTGTNQDSLKIANNGDVSFYEDTGTTAKFFWDASAERLGIGTSGPATRVHISEGASGVGTSATNILTIENDGNVRIALIAPHGSDRTIMFGNPKDNAGNYIMQGGTESGTYDNDYFKFIVGNRNVMTLLNGKVGIGTDSPKSELNISANNSGQGAKLTLENTDTSITSNDVIGQIDFYANDGSTNGTGAKVNIKAIATSNAGTVTALTLGVASSASATAVETMRLKSDEVNWTNTTNGFYNKIYGPSSGDIASGYLTYNGSTLRGGFYTNPSHGLTVISDVDMSFRANNANRMHINTSGIVTTPNVPAFLAFKSNGPVTSSQIVVWNNVYHNNGGHYSSSTGKFTAPVDGYYHFTVGAIVGGSPVDGTQRNGELQMQKNGNHYSRGHWNMNDRWENVSYTQIIYLAASDYVRINFVNATGNNEMYGSSLYSHFGGHLIG